MTEPIDIEAERIAASFKPNWRPILIGVGANLLAISLLLGVPYLRGREQALEQRVQFARFARCLFGGEIPSSPGLALPRGERDHFAGKVAFAPRNWPLSCRESLHALAPAPAVFLWPAVKIAGADLRAVVALLDKELIALHRARSQGAARVPSRPLDVLSKLQAALTLMVKAADVEDGMDDDALRFVTPPPLAAPARLPLSADENAQLELTSAGGTLEATALDNRGLAWLRLDDGKLDHQRAKRTPLVRGFLRANAALYVVWAMSSARCREREDRCVHRASGVARYDVGAEALPTPRWLGGHPSGRPDRTIRVSPTQGVDMLTLTDTEGQLALSHFELGSEPPATAGEPPPPSAATTSVPVALDLPRIDDAVLLDSPAPSVAIAGARDGVLAAEIVWPTAEPARAPLPLEGLPFEAGTPAWITTCKSPAAQWLAYGTASAFRVARVSLAVEPPVVTCSQALSASFDTAIDPELAARDHAQLACDDHHAWFFLHDAQHTLRVTQCDEAGACSAARELARDIAAFAALLVDAHATRAVVAYTGVSPHRELRVLRLSQSAAPLGMPVMPGACWDPFGGMCGAPTLALDGERILLAARDGLDLLVLESNDGGTRFETLSGFHMGAAFDPSGSAPLKQHRIRKGL